jgi:hypothetical protein
MEIICTVAGGDMTNPLDIVFHTAAPKIVFEGEGCWVQVKMIWASQPL